MAKPKGSNHMQFRILEATAIETIVKMFAAVMKMTEAEQVKKGYSVSTAGNRTVQQAAAPQGAIDGKSGQAIAKGTLVNLWQSGRDSNDVRAFIVKAKKAKTPKASSRTDSLRAMIREEILAAIANK